MGYIHICAWLLLLSTLSTTLRAAAAAAAAQQDDANSQATGASDGVTQTAYTGESLCCVNRVPVLVAIQVSGRKPRCVRFLHACVGQAVEYVYMLYRVELWVLQRWRATAYLRPCHHCQLLFGLLLKQHNQLCSAQACCTV